MVNHLCVHLSDDQHAQRNLLDVPMVRELAASKEVKPIIDCLLGKESFAVRGILFNKTPDANWKLAEHRQDIIPAKVEQEQKLRLIGNRFTASAAVVLTGYVAALSLRAAFWQSPHHFRWLLPLDMLLPARATLAVNVALYASLLWLCVMFPRALQGKERLLVAGWVPGVLLSPIQGMVSVSLAGAIQYFKAASIMVAFFAAVAIFLEPPASGSAPPEGTVP